MGKCVECEDGYKVSDNKAECESLCDRDTAGNCKSCVDKD